MGFNGAIIGGGMAGAELAARNALADLIQADHTCEVACLEAEIKAICDGDARLNMRIPAQKEASERNLQEIGALRARIQAAKARRDALLAGVNEP